MTKQPLILERLELIVDRYDGFILDVWGVLHNGVRPYPGVVETLEQLAALKKKVSLLSNAPMRAATVARRVAKIGVPRHLFQHVMSSGEEVWQCLKERHDPFYRSLGRRCIWLGPERHAGMLDGIDIELVTSPKEADFILNTGPDDLDDEATALRPLLEEAANRSVPMSCANADLHVVQGDTLIVCAGQLAKVYEAIGGQVRWHGKPFASVYQSCLELLEISDRARVLAIGDSLRTDIAGAANAGLDSLLLTDGIHEADFVTAAGDIDLEQIDLLGGAGPRPTYIGRSLRW